MTKLLKCPICGKTVPVRDDANVCSSNCRVKRWRELKKLPFSKWGILVGVPRHPDWTDEDYRLKLIEKIKKIGGAQNV